MAGLIADNVDPREMGVARGMNTVVRMIGGGVGGQVGAALLTARTLGGSSIPAESAFTITFLLSAATALVAAGIAVSLGARPVPPARDGRRATLGRRPPGRAGLVLWGDASSVAGPMRTTHRRPQHVVITAIGGSDA